MKKLAFVVFVLSFVLFGAQNPERRFVSFSEGAGGWVLETNDGRYLFKFYSDAIVETAFVPSGEVFQEASHAVVMKPEDVLVRVEQDAERIRIEGKTLAIMIDKNPFQISYYDGGVFLISEKGGYQKKDLETIEFNLTPDEVLYGAGARAVGMNRRGHRFELYNRAHYGYGAHSELLNYTMPVVVSSKKYLLHFDNAPIGYLDLDSRGDQTLSYETISGRKVYQVVTGKTWAKMLENYTALTGRQPMLPRWALGNFSSRFGYRSQAETLEVIKAFRAQSIPVDAVILDLYWFGKSIQGTLGNLAFDKETFPDPEKMIAELRAMDTETVLITEPFVLQTSERWQEALDRGVLAKDSLGHPGVFDFYFGKGGLIDIYRPEANAWFKTIYKGMLAKGVTGIWGDLGEPEAHPSFLRHETGTADQVHNIYGHDWAKLVFESFKEYQADQRPFILMRAGYSGSQRYGIVPWSGDVGKNWGGLSSQPEISLQMGLQGIAYMSSDLGGFAGDQEDDELYTRWLQYGVFQPIYRPHTGEKAPSEAVFRSAKAKALAKKAIELRYALLPYNYNLVYRNHRKGLPLMRPLFFEEPENPMLYAYSEAYLWGDDFLVSPVLKSGETTQRVYFPKGNRWYDYYSGKVYEGGDYHTVNLREDGIPTFVRGGAIIPMAKPMQSTKAYTGRELVLHFYLDEKVKASETEIYNDDGVSASARESGAYEKMEIELERKGKRLRIELENELGGAYSAERKHLELVLHHLDFVPKRVRIGLRSIPFSYDADKKQLRFEYRWDSSKEKTIVVR
ncbi:glycoside hydrolase family 31 protein [Bergeyella sp. RCAD1439]|uniref:glycoside hydrolase family 31 protein n=1 Tax=Bergeyella anatis TaxID=3113737 RepID=UPI002E198C55|nr:TIM-barrel domain-containing protein [Bergeyella sp. RCAD1439]